MAATTRQSAAQATPLRPPLDERIRAGYAAIQRNAWEEARQAFAAALAEGESPEALEGLGATLCWLDDVPGSIDARQRAFRLYQERGEARAAARVATRLAVEFASHRAEFAVADGWFQRAHRLLEGVDPGPEHVWLSLWEASMTLHFRGDTIRGKELAASAAALSRQFGLADAQLLAVGLEGLRLVDEGRIGEGLKLLDEAATSALTGELPDLEAGGNACCYVLSTCERVRDYDRAMQWLDRVVAHYREIRVGRLLTYCRAHLLGVLTWRGEWARAEEEIEAAMREAANTGAALAVDVRVRQAELRRRQGRWKQAAELLRESEGHPGAHLAWAALAFDEGDLDRTIDFVHRNFRALSSDDRLLRAAGEILLARAHAARGQLQEAEAAVARLREVAREAPTGALPAELRACEGAVAAAAGRLDEARRAFEDAIDLFARSRNPYDTACTRLSLAEVLQRLARTAEATGEAQRATAALLQLGARAAHERGTQLLARLAGATDDAKGAGGLSRRQVDVLRLLAQGLSNREIGERLFVSEFTVKRHVADILAKLDLPSRAAAAAWAVERQLT